MADPQLSLEGILDDKPVPEAKTPPAEEAKVDRPASKKAEWLEKEQAAQGLVRDPETGQFSKKAEEPAKEVPKAEEKAEEKAKPAPLAAPQQELTDKEKAFLRAAQEERGKRQALERERDELKSKLPKEADKSFWDDPEAALARQQQETRAALLNQRLQTAELIARQRHTDFDEKLAIFTEIVQQTPGLHQQCINAIDPAEFAYQVAKKHKEYQEAGNLDEFKKKIEQETEAKVRARIEAELKEKAEAMAKERAALPGSLSDARSVGGSTKPVWGGPPSLDEILKG